MVKMRTRIWSILLTCVMLLAVLPTIALASEGHWADSAVETLNGIYGSGTFTASDAAMDAEDAQVILNKMGVQATATSTFNRAAACTVLADVFDLPVGSQTAIQHLYNENILSGAAGGDLNENGSVTQAEFAVLTYRVLNSVGGGFGSTSGLKPGTEDYFAWMYLAARKCVDFDADSTQGTITSDEWSSWVNCLKQLPEDSPISQFSADYPGDTTTKLDAAKTIVDAYIDAGGSETIFSDVNNSSPYYDGVMYLFDQRIISGNGDGTFEPNTPLPRYQLAVLLCKLDEYNYNSLEDAQTHAAQYMSTGNDAWWNDTATRQEVIVAFLKQMEVDVSDVNLSILDRFTADATTISAEAKPYLAYAVSLGLVSGTSSDSISPDGGVTRGAAGVLLYRALLGVDETKMEDYRQSVNYALGQTASGISLMSFDAPMILSTTEKTLELREDWRLTEDLDLSVPAGTNLPITGGQIYEMGGRLLNSGEGTYTFDDGYALYTQNIAEVAGAQYATLAEAINAAESGDTVKLLGDCTCTSTTTFDTGEKITLDLGGNTLTLSRFDLKHGWLTVENGTVDCAGQAFNVYAGATATDELYTKLVIADDVTIHANYGICLFPAPGSKAGYSSAIDVYGNIASGGIFVSGNLGNDADIAESMANSGKLPTVHIHEGAVVNEGSEEQGISMNGLASVTVDGGTVSGREAIGVKRGTLAVNGGTFTSDGEYVDPTEANNNGTESTGATISITGTYNYAGAISVTLKDGSFTSQNAPAVYLGHSLKDSSLVAYTNGVTLDIQGGTFTSPANVTPVYVADKAAGDAGSYTKKVISGGTFSIKPDQAYLVTGYEAVEDGEDWIVQPMAEGGMAVTGSTTEDNSISATLEGVYTGANTEITTPDDSTENETANAGGALTVDLSTTNSTTSAVLTVPQNTAVSLKNAASLTLKTDVGSVKLDGNALGTIADKATAAVEIKIVKDDNTYEVTAQAGSANLLPGGDSSGTVTVSVPYTLTDGKNILVFCVDAGKHERMDSSFEDGTLTWTTSHLSTFQGVDYNSDDEVVSITNSGTAAAGTLSAALDAVKTNGGSVYLLKDASLDSSYWISGDVSIQSAGVSADTPVISAAVPVGGKCFTVYHPASLVLSDINLVIQKAEGATGTYGIDVYHGATLTMNRVALELKNLSNATISSDNTEGANPPGIFELNDTTITATDIGGNFSNGGAWKLTNHSEIQITNCVSHGVSCDSLTVDNSAVNVSGTGLLGVTAREISLVNHGEITVDDCGTGLPKTTPWSTDEVSYKYPIEIKKNGSVSVDSTSSVKLVNNKTGGEDNNILYLVNAQLQNQGTISADVKATAAQGSYVVTFVDRDMVVKSDSASGTYELPTVSDRAGYTFLGWKAEGGTTTHKAGETVPITADTTFEAQWSKNSTVGGGGGVSTYAITVPSDVDGGAVKVSPTRASSGTTVTITVTPDDGYELAKLTVTDKDGDTVKLTDKGDGKYTFTMPASAVEVEASFQEIVVEPDNPFTDVYESDYYYDAVLWAVENGVTVGTTSTTFSPNVTVSRAQMVTFLWRAYGSPEATGENPFTDVNESEYYYDAVLWAVENGVTVGTSATTFSPEAPVTRAQAVTFQWRAAGSPAASGDSFNDVADDVWYSDAVTWAVANEITNGTGGNNFSPEVAVSRAQAVTFLYRELA